MAWYDGIDDGDYHFDDVSEEYADQHGADSLSWLRGHTPRDRTSTYDPSSGRAKLGAAAEILVRKKLRIAVAELDLVDKIKVDLWGECMYTLYTPLDLWPFPTNEAWAIDNSKNGDIYVTTYSYGWKVKHSIEVKSSLEWPSASISRSELEHSEAKFLVAVTTAGLWACTMEEARRVAVEIDGRTGKFWTVHPDRVKKVSMQDVIRG